MSPEVQDIVLKPRQLRFVEEYLVDLNATKAAVRAGYSQPSAHVTSSRILARRDVRTHIEGALANRFGVTKLSIIEELAAIAFHDIGNYVSWTNESIRIIPSAKLSAWQRKAIASVRRTGPEAGNTELKLCDKLRALELLARVLGLLEPGATAAPPGQVHFIIETP